MGFHSWKTCDTQKSIPAAASGRPMQPVYLLQPNGLPAIKEECYEGYGDFGGLNAYLWLAKTNAEALGLDSDLSDDELVNIGISLDLGDVMQDTNTGEIWHVFHDARAVVPGNHFAGPYDATIPEYNDNANNLAQKGTFKRVDIRDLVDLPYPLKFSFDPNAVYEDHDASEICPDQGYFYPDDDDDLGPSLG